MLTNRKLLGLIFTIVFGCVPGLASSEDCPDLALARWLAAPHRQSVDVQRDVYRHPCSTLQFFGLRPGASVMEIWPGRGWYADILAPYLQDQGTYIAAHFNPESPSAFYRDTRRDFEHRLATLPDHFGKTNLVSFDPAAAAPPVPPGSVDLILTFRNVHNWYMRGGGDARVISAFRQMYDALAPGGTLGVVEHRLPAGQPVSRQETSGYMLQSEVIRLAGAAGFLLVATSEVNANPRDSADHADGVWALPPTLRGGDVGRPQFEAIGESDRMTLRFRKPAYALAPCPSRDNCVSSQETRDRYRIEPVSCAVDALRMREVLVRSLAAMPRTRITESDHERLKVEFRTRWWRFVDDAEFLLRPGRIDMRSASRVGYSDLGVNRRRMEALRETLRQEGCSTAREPVGNRL